MSSSEKTTFQQSISWLPFIKWNISGSGIQTLVNGNIQGGFWPLGFWVLPAKTRFQQSIPWFPFIKWNISCSRIQTLVNGNIGTDSIGKIYAIVIGDTSIGKMKVGNVTIDSKCCRRLFSGQSKIFDVFKKKFVKSKYCK